jgi:hypothetical protein
MAKPRIFISSTFYDLKQVRADLDNFITSLGYDPVRNEEGDIPYGKDEALEEYCYKEIKGVDVLVSIIGGRYGSESKNKNSSVSQLELKTAIKEGKQVYIFIENSVLSEYETYLLNKEAEVKFRYVDDKRIYGFIEEIKALNLNNNIKGFDTASDITKYLKEQFAGLFQRFLEEQTRIKEVSLITNLEKTAQTLNKLVNYLSDENKGQAEEINKILSINHPLVAELRTKLEIPYNFYIEGGEDLAHLLTARGFKKDIDFDFGDIWVRKNLILRVSDELFDEEGRLKFIRTSDWKDSYVTLEEQSNASDQDPDDIPF